MQIHEQVFAENIKEDIENFLQKSSPKRSVLVLPPLKSKFRYLAHQVVDEFYFPILTSFSIGLEKQRRVIVGFTTYISRCCLPYTCVHEKLNDISKAEDRPIKCVCSTRLISLTSTTGLSSLMPSNKGEVKVKNKSMKDLKSAVAGNSSEREDNYPRKNLSSLREKNKRPDKQLYVPRALRGCQNKHLPTQEKCEDFDESKSLHKATHKSENQDFCSQSSETKRTMNCSNSFVPCTKCDNHHTDSFETLQSEDLDNKVIGSSSITKSTVKKDAVSIPTTVSCPENTKSKQKNHSLDIAQVYVLTPPICCQNNEDDTSDKVVSEDKFSSGVSDALQYKYRNSETELRVNYADENHKTEKFQGIALDKCDKPITKTSDQVKPSTKDEEHDDSWETMFNDDGECLNPDFVKELSNVVGRIQIHVPENSYSEYQPSENMSGEFDNIVELYGFPKEFSTQDLVSALSFFQQSSFTIKWVDDCHALALFSSPAMVNQALQLNHPFVKVRPLSEGIKESKAKARWCASNCEPSKLRPATSAILARRLVSGALGLKVQTTKEQRELERNLLKEAKEKKKLKAKQRQDIWDGVVR